MRLRTGPAARSAICSALRLAMVFGATSPNTRTARVKTPVATPTILLPKSESVTVVASEEA